ncbi:MAG: DUF3617 domain-containing protein [Betaproteobacteria bacterium]|nr:DUF3617 domain-containing protein [Betaproteobacteria bacterium]
MSPTRFGFTAALTALTVLAPAASPEAAPAKGEQWDYAMTMEMEGMKMPLPATRVCVAPEEGNTPPVEKHCKLKERKVRGITTTFHIVCGPPEPGELKGEFTRKGDRVEGRYTMKQDGESMTVVATGRKLGDCDPSKPPIAAARK